MPSSFADTSFLFALYGDDAHSAEARAWVSRSSSPIMIAALGRFELGNAIRFALFRRLISKQDAFSSLAALSADIESEHLQVADCDYRKAIREADRLSELHTPVGGHRSFDILHVATARILGAGTFLSFDANQRKLASAGGIKVAP